MPPLEGSKLVFKALVLQVFFDGFLYCDGQSFLYAVFGSDVVFEVFESRHSEVDIYSWHRLLSFLSLWSLLLV